MPFETIEDFAGKKRRVKVHEAWTKNSGATLIALLRAYFDSYNADYDLSQHLHVDTIVNVTEERNRLADWRKLRQIEDVDSRLAYHLGDLASKKFEFTPLGDALWDWDASPERKAQLGFGTFIQGGRLKDEFTNLLDGVFGPYYTATKAALESSDTPSPEAAASSSTPVPEPSAPGAADTSSTSAVEAAAATPAPVVSPSPAAQAVPSPPQPVPSNAMPPRLVQTTPSVVPPSAVPLPTTAQTALALARGLAHRAMQPSPPLRRLESVNVRKVEEARRADEAQKVEEALR